MLGDLFFNAFLRIRDAVADLIGLGRLIVGDWWDWTGRALIGTLVIMLVIAGLMVRHTERAHPTPTTAVPTAVTTR